MLRDWYAKLGAHPARGRTLVVSSPRSGYEVAMGSSPADHRLRSSSSAAALHSSRSMAITGIRYHVPIRRCARLS